MVPVKQKCLACRWDIYCSTNNLLWWSKPSQGAESDAAAIHLLPCFPFQGHGNWSGRVAYLTSSPKNGDAWLPDSEPQGRTSSHCKKTDAVPLKNKNMHNRLMSWGSQAWGRCPGKSPQVHRSHLSQEKCQGMGTAKALPDAGTSISVPWWHRSWC